MAVKHGLLALIEERPRYGYELKTEFEAATGGIWTINVGQVYTTLDRLERDGMVSVNLIDDETTTDTGPQKHYELTAQGREALGDWWEATPEGQPARDELLIKVLLAIQHSRSTALEVITRQRTALFAQLQRSRQQQRQDQSEADLASQLVADALIVRAEANLRWLDQCEATVLKASPNAFAATNGTEQ